MFSMLSPLVALRALGAALLLAPSPANTDTSQKAGYWLSVDLIGPAAARSDAAFALTAQTNPRSPRDGRLPGQAVGHVDDIHAVIAWLERHAFDAETTTLTLDPLALAEADAPIVGGMLRERFDVQMRAMVVTGATAAGDRRTIDWPADARRILPEGSRWHAAALLPQSAPLFAAPSPTLPPASERFALARRRGDVFVVGTVDRCTPQPARRCLRWAQVVVRIDDRFVPGYLPASTIALRDRWQSTTEERLPRAQLVRIGVRSNSALLLLVARDDTGTLHQRTIEMPMSSETGSNERFPEVSLVVDGHEARLVSDLGTQTFTLDTSLDARPLEDSANPVSPAPADAP